MPEESSIALIPRDYTDITRLSDPTVFEDFLDEPLTFIAETLTGVLGSGMKGVNASGGRIVQAILKGRLFAQWALEFKTFRASGRIPDDFAERKYGFQTWVELMTIIDEESPDQDRLTALKALFFAVNKMNATDGERVKAYQLWQIAKRLGSGELLLLRAAYEFRDGCTNSGYRQWEEKMASAVGHGMNGLISLHEKILTDSFLLSPRLHGDGSGITPHNARLTDLGLSLCENIQSYELELRDT